jgi:hypothetical protein
MVISSWRLRWRYFGGWQALGKGLVVAVFGLLIVVSMLLATREDLIYRSEGTSVTARVIGKGTRKAFRQRSRSGRWSTDYWLRYEFRDLNGRVHQGTQNAGRDLWDRCREGSPVAVEYLRARPGESRLALGESGYSWLVRTGVCGVGLLFFAGASVGTVQGWRDAVKRVQLIRDGTPAVGRVTEIVAKGPLAKAGRVPIPQHLLYLFADAHGEEHRGESGPLPPQLAARWRPCDRLLVLYDLADPGRNEPDLFGARPQELAQLLDEQSRG